jgi:hypothetical protein
VVQLYDRPEGRLLSTFLMADLDSPSVTPVFRKVVLDAIATSYPAPEKPHPIPHHPEMHGFRAALEAALGATVRSRVPGPAQVSARVNELLRGALRKREEAAKVNVPFVESMRYSRPRRPPTAPASRPRKPTQRGRVVAGGRPDLNDGGATLASAALPDTFAGLPSYRSSVPGFARPAPSSSRRALLPLPAGSHLHRAGLPRRPPASSSAALALAAPPPPSTPAAISASSFVDRPRRTCRCAGGSRWPTNR